MQRPGLDVIGGILSSCLGILGMGRLAIGLGSGDQYKLPAPQGPPGTDTVQR